MPTLKTKDDFVKDARAKHGNHYDYSKVVYVNNGTKVEILCPEHGSFWITPASHSSAGRGCAKCRGGVQRTKDEFIELAKKRFPNFDYSKVVYVNSFKKVELVCPNHGSFYIIPAKLLSTSVHGCQKCSTGEINRLLKERGSINKFIENATKVHGDKYDYSNSVYISSSKKININCSIHGTFEMLANNHTSKQYGCPKCSNSGFSKEEKEVVEWLRSVYAGEIVENSRSIIGPKELDIYLPEKAFAIEYNGLYWHSGDKIDKKAHLNKTLECKSKDIRLFHIFSDEWRDKGDIVKSMIKYRLGMVDRKIAARKCKIVNLDKDAGRTFFINSHISGDNRAQVYYGLEYCGKIVAAISLKKPIQKKYGNVLEIARFANALNTTVQGGFQKLFSFARQYAIDGGYVGILTYADRRFGDGDTYLNSGFAKVGYTNIDYWYADCQNRYFRFKFRARDGLSEKQIVQRSCVFPVYGCGNVIYQYSLI